MPQNNHVLAIIDPTATEHPVLDRAALLAARLQRPLELFICDYDQYLAGERFFDADSLTKARDSLIENHKQNLEKLAAGLVERRPGDGLDISVDACWDHPLYEGIVRKVERAQPAFVVKDTHYHALLKRTIFSNTDWNLIRDCPAPLWLVKPHPIAERPRIIAAVDPVHERDKPAELDHAILTRARELAGALGGEAHVLHAFDPSPAYAASADSMAFPIATPIRELLDSLKQSHESAVNELVASYDIDSSRVHIIEGDTRSALNKLAEDIEADVVVMGAVSRGALQRLVLGSTAEHVLDHVTCDVLVLKPSAFESPASARG